MSQSMSSAPIRHSHHILIIDDSARLRYALADLIVAACLATGKSYRVFHGDKDGRFTQSNESLNPGMLAVPPATQAADPLKLDEFAVYTAPSPKQALFVINSPLFTRLTIICDVMMPSDTEVGIVGMLEALARRNLPVNLVFASSDAQNRQLIARLVDSGKAYFVVKADRMWQDLSQALVNRTDSFQYKNIAPSDYAGLLGGPMQGSYNNSAVFPHENFVPQPVPAAAAASPPHPHSAAPAPPPPQPNARPATKPVVAQSTPTPAANSAKPKSGHFNPFAALIRAIRGR
jgi:CheY-like chemotaxis protein